SLNSLGGNNFRTFLDTDAKDKNGNSKGRFAIYISNDGVDAKTGQVTSIATTEKVSAQNNLYSVTDPNTVVKDKTNNTTVGGGPTGAGRGDPGTPQLSGNAMSINALYTQSLGRTPTAAEVTFQTSQITSNASSRTTVANNIIRSDEGLGFLVNNLFKQF